MVVSCLENRKKTTCSLTRGSVQPELNSCWCTSRHHLGPLLFLLYINDIVSEKGSNIRLFANDTSLFIIFEHPNNAEDILNLDLEKMSLGSNLVGYI